MDSFPKKGHSEIWSDNFFPSLKLSAKYQPMFIQSFLVIYDASKLPDATVVENRVEAQKTFLNAHGSWLILFSIACRILV